MNHKERQAKTYREIHRKARLILDVQADCDRYNETHNLIKMHENGIDYLILDGYMEAEGDRACHSILVTEKYTSENRQWLKRPLYELKTFSW
jgi:hypothetical protein